MHGTLETGFFVEIRTLAELAPIAAELRELAARACEPNVFYEPDFIAAAAPVFGREVRAGLVLHRGAPARLAGFFPVRMSSRRYGFKLPVAVGWTHPYGPLGVPLIDRERSAAVVAAWLERLATYPGLPKLVLLPYLPAQGAAAQAFEAALVHRGGRFADYARHERALLAPDGARADYLERAIPRRHRKERRRQRQRLADLGLVETTVVRDAPSIVPALDDFFALEAGGWKGRAGTATVADQRLRGFVTSAVTALAREDKASVSRLSVNGQAIAAAITLRSGDSAWGWKIAYDESFRRASPGVQVLLDVTQTLLKDERIARADSCATPDHPMIDHIWRERLVLTDRLICVGPNGIAGFAAARAFETLRRGLAMSAKAMRDLLQRT